MHVHRLPPSVRRSGPDCPGLSPGGRKHGDNKPASTALTPIRGPLLPTPTAAESRTSQLRSRIRRIRKSRDFPGEASEFEVGSTGNPPSALLTRSCLRGVKKAWPERRASYLWC